jgi:hypothetical protein
VFSPFQNCWDRVDRAEAHRQASIERWNAFDTSQTYTSRVEVDNDGTGRFFTEPVKRDWTLPFSLELGEMLYQLRSALDSCVYDAAVLRFGDPPPDPKQWQFPITSKPADFKEAIRRMKDIPADVAAIIERVQGYSRLTCIFDGNQFDIGPTLVILNDWARIDRHRQLHLVGTALTGGRLAIGSPLGMGVEYCNFIGGDVLENQSEIARFKIRNFVPGTKLSFHPEFSFEIMVDESPRVRLQEIALAMGMSVSVTRELFENHFGVKR